MCRPSACSPPDGVLHVGGVHRQADAGPYQIPFGTAIPLALGSVAGGLAGEKLLQVIVDAPANSAVTVVQNVVLSLLILAVFLYMKNKSRIPSQELRGVVVSLLVGVFLGICSSFLASAAGPSTWPHHLPVLL